MIRDQRRTMMKTITAMTVTMTIMMAKITEFNCNAIAACLFLLASENVNKLTDH